MFFDAEAKVGLLKLIQTEPRNIGHNAQIAAFVGVEGIEATGVTGVIGVIGATTVPTVRQQ